MGRVSVMRRQEAVSVNAQRFMTFFPVYDINLILFGLLWGREASALQIEDWAVSIAARMACSMGTGIFKSCGAAEPSRPLGRIRSCPDLGVRNYLQCKGSNKS